MDRTRMLFAIGAVFFAIALAGLAKSAVSAEAATHWTRRFDCRGDEAVIRLLNISSRSPHCHGVVVSIKRSAWLKVKSMITADNVIRVVVVRAPDRESLAFGEVVFEHEQDRDGTRVEMMPKCEWNPCRYYVFMMHREPTFNRELVPNDNLAFAEEDVQNSHSGKIHIVYEDGLDGRRREGRLLLRVM